MIYTLREMTAADFEPIAAWMVTIPLWQRHGVIAERMVTQFGLGLARGDVMLVADTGDTIPAGFAWMLPQGMFGRNPYLRLIGVHPECAGQGIGTALMDAIELRARDYADALFLLVSDFNTGAQRLYERRGFTRIGAIPDYITAGVTEYIYWKRTGESIAR